MKIKEIDNLNLNDYYLKLSKNSITIKDINNKTRKVINDVSSVQDLQFNKKVDLNIKLQRQGISLAELLNKYNNLYIDKDNNLYHFTGIEYINNLSDLLNANVIIIKCKLLS